MPSFKEGVFRGAFGAVFRKLVCASPQQENCRECMLFRKCAFSIIFSPGTSKGDKFLKNFDQVPRPFTIQIQNSNKKISVEDKLKVQVVLVGKAIEYFPYVFLTIKELGNAGFGVKNEEGEKGKYYIDKVTEVLLDNSHREIYSSKNPDTWLPIQGFSLEEVIEEKKMQECSIKFETPVRLKQNGRIAQFVDFRTLIRSIITRVNALTYFFGDGSINTDVKDFLEEAERVNVSKCNTRFVEYKWHSGRQKTNLKLGGLVGEVEYHGNITPFYPYLKMAEILGVGKNTTFGFGRIKVQD